MKKLFSREPSTVLGRSPMFRVPAAVSGTVGFPRPGTISGRAIQGGLKWGGFFEAGLAETCGVPSMLTTPTPGLPGGRLISADRRARVGEATKLSTGLEPSTRLDMHRGRSMR